MLTPKNKRFLIKPVEQNQSAPVDTEASFFVTKTHKPIKPEYGLYTVLDFADEPDMMQLTVGNKILVEENAVEEVPLNGETLFFIKQNFIVAVVK